MTRKTPAQPALERTAAPALVAAAGLTPYQGNSRTHSAAQVGQLQDSIEAFGMVGAIVIRNGVIAKGHGTLQAVKAIYTQGGLIYPPPGKDAGAEPYPAGMVPVIDASGWSDAQFRAYVIADNRLALNAGWNEDALMAEVAALEGEGLDLGLLGFDPRELDSLLEGEGLVPVTAGSSDHNTRGARQRLLKVDRIKVPMTDDEADRLGALLTAYGERQGVVHGFASWLLDQVAKAQEGTQ